MECKEKKGFLLKVNSDWYSKFKELCDEEGVSVTYSLNKMIRNSVKKGKLW